MIKNGWLGPPEVTTLNMIGTKVDTAIFCVGSLWLPSTPSDICKNYVGYAYVFALFHTYFSKQVEYFSKAIRGSHNSQNGAYFDNDFGKGVRRQTRAVPEILHRQNSVFRPLTSDKPKIATKQVNTLRRPNQQEQQKSNAFQVSGSCHLLKVVIHLRNDMLTHTY